MFGATAASYAACRRLATNRGMAGAPTVAISKISGTAMSSGRGIKNGTAILG
jgi:hypothetical protein